MGSSLADADTLTLTLLGPRVVLVRSQCHQVVSVGVSRTSGLSTQAVMLSLQLALRMRMSSAMRVASPGRAPCHRSSAVPWLEHLWVGRGRGHGV